MKTRKIGNLEVSEIGMGCMGFSHGYGKIPDEQYSIEAIREAYDYGCTFYDTAEVYGPELKPENKGHNEKIVGKAVKPFRSNIVLATKLHIPTDEAEAKGVYQTVKDHLTASLERLDTDYADLYYLHRMNDAVPVEEVAEAMGKLIQEGLIRGWGLSAVGVETMERVQKITPLTAIQNIYNMVERGVEKDVIPYCEKNNIGMVAFSPTSSGLLSGKLNKQTQFAKVDDVRNFVPQLKQENIAGNQPIVDMLEAFAAQKGFTPVQISLAWMIAKYPNVVPIPGSKNKGRILENLKSSEVNLSADEVKALDEALSKFKVYGQRGYEESEGHSFLDKK